MESKDIKVAISHGDYNGIGYEVIIKTFANPEMLSLCTPIIYGSSKLASFHKKVIEDNFTQFNLVRNSTEAVTNRLNMVNIYFQEAKVQLGTSSPLAGELAHLALEHATADLLNSSVDVLVTAPINKDNIQSAKFNFHGHTEYLADKFKAAEVLMFLVCDNLRIGVVTGHIAIKDVATTITKDLIVTKLKIMIASLKRDFGIRKPKIAVLGLNPHSGDNGLIGKEEIEIISPAIKEMSDSRELVFGPFSADGFFASGKHSQFDAVLCMYHDQGLVAFKILAFDSGVNFTAGLPIVRTSPDHGTAYDIAGKGIANPDSFKAAVYLALDIYRNRKTYDEINANPLKYSSKNDKGKDESINPFSEEINL
ncbi:MAG: 4-hydroxythreonine-4-phosphate dehydrogenase PdxA [Bacteroidetes bacterium CG2_30_33_31]|nr:MAG: 4-hydroxythreonine-4-phosphate dehydrogenase PdxA [Bacteroidetes bacterium CG2_30_33_31]